MYRGKLIGMGKEKSSGDIGVIKYKKIE